ncbi:hypothetical protein CDD83_911 [Cordyceps sp. RAO-2017]|nr:hypothetical protein CDD83_911 [Cordyceps sp. RAO-2017]
MPAKSSVTALAVLAAVPLFVSAQNQNNRSNEVDIEMDDVPMPCRTICGPVVELARRCKTDLRGDNNDADEDRLEAQCYCRNTSFDVGKISGLCADCMHKTVNQPGGGGNNNDDDDDNKARADADDKSTPS